MDSEATFRTPEHLEPGELFRVELVLLDKAAMEEKRRK
jgi:hypothetical protein